MDAVLVRLHPAHGPLQARVSASTEGARVTIAYDPEVTELQNLAAAARACALRSKWRGATFVGGKLPSGDWAFVNTDPHKLTEEAHFST